MKYKKYVYCYNNFKSIDWLSETDAFALKMSGDNTVVNMTKKHGMRKSDCVQLKILHSVENQLPVQVDKTTEVDWVIMWKLIKDEKVCN